MAGAAAHFELIVGLGNPGARYDQTRHNAGFWFVDEVARAEGVSFSSDSKFHGELAKFSHAGRDIRLLKPSTFMNRSGQSVAAVARYFKIPVENILVVHDELDIPPGALRLKLAGGHGGHNGLRDIITHMGKDFWRLRVGIGHPGHRDKVVDYVLERASAADQQLIDQALWDAQRELSTMLDGALEKAMHALHSRK
jgi:PTH1 family peptidyl-tRNA hydrolase